MTTYQELDKQLHDKRYKPPQPMKRRKVANNTWLERHGEEIGVVFHSTTILVFRPNGTVTMRNGGWDTVTTKYRLNTFLGKNLSVVSMHGRWMIEARQTEKLNQGVHWRSDSTETVWTHSVMYPFYDGISFDAESGLLVWNPYGWTPMEYVDGMFTAEFANRLAALENALEEAVDGDRPLTNEFIDECLQRRESVEKRFKEIKVKLDREVRGLEWRMQTTLERTMRAFQKSAEVKAHNEKAKRLGWCSICAEYGHSDESPHQINLEGGEQPWSATMPST